MKRPFNKSPLIPSLLVVLLMWLFNWNGNQLDKTIGQYFNQTLGGKADQQPTTYKISGFNMPVYEKVIDSDDLLEFSNSNDHPENEIVVNAFDDLFPDRASSENKHVSYHFFNHKYYDKPDNRLAKYYGAVSSLKLPDRYLLIIPIVFLSPQAHPPQQIG